MTMGETNGAAHEPWQDDPPPGRFDDEEPAPAEVPTALEPLRGLPALAAVALVGRDRILEIAHKPIAFVWRDIAVAATIIVLAGGPGEGKTTLLFLVLIARMNLGDPVDVLGRRVEPAPHGKWIVLIEGEHGETSAGRKLERSCELLGVHNIALQRIVLVARKAVRIGSAAWDDVTKLVAAGLVSDIALDTIARVAPADGNDEREQAAIFDIVAQTIDAAPSEADKPTAWVCAHTRKNATGGDLTDVSGSTQRTGQADTVLLVKGERVDGRTVSSTVTFAKLREEPDDFPTPVTFAIVRTPEGARRLDVGDAHGDDDAPLEVRIEHELAIAPRTKNWLATKLHRSKAHIEEAISILFAARHITTTTITTNGREFKAFALRPGSTGLSTGLASSEEDRT